MFTVLQIYAITNIAFESGLDYNYALKRLLCLKRNKAVTHQSEDKH